jgi:hypothetical protein
MSKIMAGTNTSFFQAAAVDDIFFLTMKCQWLSVAPASVHQADLKIKTVLRALEPFCWSYPPANTRPWKIKRNQHSFFF